jgi:hypothetical protein
VPIQAWTREVDARAADKKHARRIDDHKRPEQRVKMKRRKKHATTLSVAEAYTNKLRRYHHSVSSRSEAAPLCVGQGGSVFTLTKVEYYARLPRLLYPHGFYYE